MSQTDLVELHMDFMFHVKTIAKKRLIKIAPGMHMMHIKALRFIGKNPDTTQQELVEISGRDKGQVARVMKELQGMELVNRQQDSIDKRKYKLRLSKQGERMTAKIDALFITLESELSSNVDLKKLKVHASVIRTMLETAKQLT